MCAHPFSNVLFIIFLVSSASWSKELTERVWDLTVQWYWSQEGYKGISKTWDVPWNTMKVINNKWRKKWGITKWHYQDQGVPQKYMKGKMEISQGGCQRPTAKKWTYFLKKKKIQAGQNDPNACARMSYSLGQGRTFWACSSCKNKTVYHPKKTIAIVKHGGGSIKLLVGAASIEESMDRSKQQPTLVQKTCRSLLNSWR